VPTTTAQAAPKEPFHPRFVRRAIFHALGFAAFLALPLAGFFRCPFALLFHAPCPGCGTTRALRGLLHLDLVAMLRWNPVSPLVFVAGGGLAARAVYLIALEGDARRLGQGRLGRALTRGIIAAAALELVVWVLRWFGLFGGPVPV